MELSLWPSGRCTLLWVAFSLAAASRGLGRVAGWDGMGAGGLAKGMVGAGGRGSTWMVAVAGHWGRAPLLSQHQPPHGHVKVGVFAGKRQRGATNTGWHRGKAGAEMEDEYEGGKGPRTRVDCTT